VNIVTALDYNPSGTLNWVKDGENRYTYFIYDASDRKTKMTYSDNKTQQWLYDDAGNLESRTTVNNETQAFFYDDRNFMYATWWTPNWDNGIVDWCFFDHDAEGRLTEAENGTNGWNTNIISDVHRYYDAAGRLTQEQQIVTGLARRPFIIPPTITMEIDTHVRRRRYGLRFHLFLRCHGRFENIFLTAGGQLFQYHYDAASNETGRDNLVNGVNQVYPRDALNRMQYMDVKKDTTILTHAGYTYDSMNRITLVSWPMANTDSFTYYLDGELKQANLGNFGHNITYNSTKRVIARVWWTTT